jgi:hypothetical protein
MAARSVVIREKKILWTFNIVTGTQTRSEGTEIYCRYAARGRQQRVSNFGVNYMKYCKIVLKILNGKEVQFLTLKMIIS